MVSPEMLPVHLRNIKKRLLGTPDSLKHDRMILDQAAERLIPVGAVHPLIQRYGPLDVNDSISIMRFVRRIQDEVK